MMLRATDLGWRARGRDIVRSVSLSLASGEMLGLVGPNGSGKSTLLRMLAGLVKPSRGGVELLDRPMRTMRQRDIARRLAFVAQSSETAERLTVRETVELGRTPWLDALRPWSNEDDHHVEQALQRVDMESLGGREWSTLSGGERQRAHIARALAQTPRILLLDEPTNHLDIHHQLSILDLVGQLGLSTIVALHDLNQAMRCDRVAVLHEGELVALGSPTKALTPELLRRVFAVRVSRLIDPADDAQLMRFHPLN